MKFSYTLGLTACAALLAASGVASAAVTIYGTSGYVVSAQDAAGHAGACAAYQQAVGNPSSAQIYYPGSGVVGLAEETGGTSPSSTTSNSSATYSCIDSSGAPAIVAGHTTPSFSLACYADTMAGPGSSPVVALTQTLKVAAVGANGVKNTNVLDVETTTNFLGAGLATYCTTITDSTWIKQ